MKRDIRVLIIDNDEKYLIAIKALLIEEGYTVQVSNDVSLALLLLEQESYDIIITDIQNPKYSGADIIQHIYTLYPDAPVIATTACGTIEEAISFMKSGVFHYVVKPLENESLLQIMQSASELVSCRRQYNALYNNVTRRETCSLFAHTQHMRRVVDSINKIKDSLAHVVIEGECGVGKKYVAQYIHAHSRLHSLPLDCVDIEVYKEKELESLLFDENEGKNLFERTQGALLLHGVESMPYSIQVKVARYLSKAMNNGEYIPRIFATSRGSLEEYSKLGLFSYELYCILAIFRISIPPLRERREDIPHFAVSIMKEITEQEKMECKRFSPDVLRYLTNYEWYGNIRELKMMLRRIALTTQEKEIHIHHLPSELQEEHTRFTSAVDLLPISLNLSDTLEKIEEQLIRRALVHCNFVQTRAASLLGISKSRLQYKLMKYEIAGHQLHY